MIHMYSQSKIYIIVTSMSDAVIYLVKHQGATAKSLPSSQMIQNKNSEYSSYV